MVPQPAIAGAVDVRAGAAPVRAYLDWRNIGKMFFSILLISYNDGGLVVVKSNKQTNIHTPSYPTRLSISTPYVKCVYKVGN